MTFRTTFDLTGFDPATATIDGRFTADDWIVQVRLNGKTLPLGNHRVYEWQALHIGEGFIMGKNTVEIVVMNDPAVGPSFMGLCVQWKGAAPRREAGGGKMTLSGGSRANRAAAWGKDWRGKRLAILKRTVQTPLC